MNRMGLVLLVLLATVVMMPTAAGAREIERRVPMILDDATMRTVPAGRVFGVNAAQTPDTFYYGGTQIISNVAYAVPSPLPGMGNGRRWTWSPLGYNGVPHSGLNMDGWVRVDNTAQGVDYVGVADNATMGAFCVINGTKSLFFGATNQECVDLCFVDVDGTGYGNDWHQGVVTKTYLYNPGDQILLTYYYNNETEPEFDFTYVILQYWNGVIAEWENYDTMAAYTDVVSGFEVIDVDSYMSALSPPLDFRIRFTFSADGGYSDADGLYPTACGGFELDDYVLDINGTSDGENFEGVAVGDLPVGWSIFFDDCGNFAQVKALGDLPMPVTLDPCVGNLGTRYCEMADSVLVFIDETNPAYPHPLCQDNYALSPIIDLSAFPARPGRYLYAERFASLPLANRVFMFWRARYRPGCASGNWSPWVSDNNLYYTPEGTSCRPFEFDISSYVPRSAEQVEISLGVVNLCANGPWAPGCDYVCNASPYFDNVTFGVFGEPWTPYISMREFDYWQDQFAEDGTLNPTSTADTRIANYLADLVPPIFGDTLTCRGVDDNMEVYFVFRLDEVGPRQTNAAPFWTWFPGAQLGNWCEARMDTTRVTDAAGTGTITVPGRYMCTFHEDDPIRAAQGLPEGTEILPNNVFVPGTKISYFLKTRYVGPGDWFYLPDTTGNGGGYTYPYPSRPDKFEEFTILPSYRDDSYGGLEWPCLIYADHFGQRGNQRERNSHRFARHMSYLGLDFDMYNKLGPTSNLMNGIGRWADNPGQTGGPGADKYCAHPGATMAQFLAYKYCVLNAGDVYTYSMYQQDVELIDSWLRVYSSASRPTFFWLSGDQVVRELNRRLPWGRTFLNNTLCAFFAHSNYAAQNSDFTYCLPINYVAGCRIPFWPITPQYVVVQNGCPRTYSVIGVATSAGCNAGYERQYDSNMRIAVVSNEVYGQSYKTVTEGYDNCVIRTDASAGFPGCSGDADGTPSALTSWLSAVLTWGGYSAGSVCNPSLVEVSLRDTAPAVVVSSLGAVYPNPMNPTATINYTVGVPGRVMLRIFDVTGRVIKTLVDENQDTGAHAVIWDGTNDRGEKLASGVFFYQFEATGYKSAKKLVIVQ